MTTAPVTFCDTETTGLDPDQHEIWEVGLITPDEKEHHWFLPVDLGRADPRALAIGQFHERYDYSEVSSLCSFAMDFAELTRGLHLVGAVISFDEERLRKLLRRNGACPEWHYHIVDSEALGAGYLGVEPPWDSDDLSHRLGLDPDNFERHTALGDSRWARAMYRAVMDAKR
jgi:DNA polymerase III epsilon subunit-like protein